MEQGKDRSLVAKVMDGLVSGIVEGQVRRHLAAAGRAVERVRCESHRDAGSAVDVACARHAGRASESRHARAADARLADDRRRRGELAIPGETRSAVHARRHRIPDADRTARDRAGGGACDGCRHREHPRSVRCVQVLQPGDSGYDTADELLHTRIVQASGNQFFQQMAAIVRGAVRLVNPRVVQKEGAHDVVVKAHARVVDAIERRDPREAEAASLALIDFSADEISRDFSVDVPMRA